LALFYFSLPSFLSLPTLSLSLSLSRSFFFLAPLPFHDAPSLYLAFPLFHLQLYLIKSPYSLSPKPLVFSLPFHHLSPSLPLNSLLGEKPAKYINSISLGKTSFHEHIVLNFLPLF